MNVQYELYSVGLAWGRERYLNNSLAKVHRPFIDEAVGRHSLLLFRFKKTVHPTEYY
jgi:hypothetical protein